MSLLQEFWATVYSYYVFFSGGGGWGQGCIIVFDFPKYSFCQFILIAFGWMENIIFLRDINDVFIQDHNSEISFHIA